MSLPMKQNFQVGKERRQLTIYNIAEVLLKIFRPYVGQRYALSRNELFKKLYNKSYTESLSDEVRWEYTKKAMHRLRQQSNCFVVSERRQDDWYFFVAQSRADADIYVNHLDNAIKKMRSMQKRAGVAVDQEWWKQTWALPGRVRKPELVNQ